MDRKSKTSWGLLFGCLAYLTGIVWGGVWLVNHTIRLVPWGAYFNSFMIYCDNMDTIQFVVTFGALILAMRVLELQLKLREVVKILNLRGGYRCSGSH